MENLASKYRPKTLDDVVEQSVVISIVKNMCSAEEITNRNFLFIGPAGTGKTSTARAVARELNEGSLSNVIELDAASHSGVDSVRDIIEQMKSYPVGSKYKTFILDEVHSFSSNAWQALLKSLEEQPARSLVMMCTTNPEKIPNTILSRVQTFQLSKISLEGIYNRLIYILEQEGYVKIG